MPITKSYGGFIAECESLLAAGEAIGDPSLAAHLAALAEILVEIKALKARQETLTGERQQTTQQLHGLLEKGRVIIIHLRGAARVALGYKNERLTQFGVAPRRKRSGKPAPAEGPPIPVEDTSSDTET
jgi:transposase